MSTQLTPEQLPLARHALGLPNDRGRSYRNRYHVSGGDRQAAWIAMVDSGLATREGSRGFSLTEAGARAALKPGETLCLEDFPHTTKGDDE